MRISTKQHRPIRRSGVDDYKKFYASKSTALSHSIEGTTEEKISNDLSLALEVTARLSQNLDDLVKDSACSEFLTCHRLIRGKITSNRSVLAMLIDNVNKIGLTLEGQEELQYPDYFTK